MQRNTPRTERQARSALIVTLERNEPRVGATFTLPARARQPRHSMRSARTLLIATVALGYLGAFAAGSIFGALPGALGVAVLWRITHA
jgi:hypothetical protein